MEELTGKIELYLNGLLSADEHAAFEAEIAADPKLKAEVELQQKTTALLKAAAFEQTRQQVAELNANRQSASSYTFLKVAASIVLLVGLGYYLIHIQYSDSALYSAYNAPYPDRITTMGANDHSAAKALQFYNEKNYAAAANEFQLLAESGRYEERFTIYEAVALTNSKRPSEAIERLEKHLATKPADAVACEWQLILAYLAAENGKQAETLLKEFLQHNNGYQNEKATELLAELNSIWR